jgi:hypothetical protein
MQPLLLVDRLLEQSLFETSPHLRLCSIIFSGKFVIQRSRWLVISQLLGPCYSALDCPSATPRSRFIGEVPEN